MTTESRDFIPCEWQRDGTDYTDEQKLVLAQLSRKEWVYRSITGMNEELEDNGLDASAVSRILSGLVQSGIVYQANSRIHGTVFVLRERI